MKLPATAACAAALIALSACGGGSESTADRLEDAAAQSDPAAAEVLENAAAAAEEGADVSAQQALQRAGNAQAETLPPQPGELPPVQQAVPHKAGDPVPPPQATVNTQ